MGGNGNEARKGQVLDGVKNILRILENFLMDKI